MTSFILIEGFSNMTSDASQDEFGYSPSDLVDDAPRPRSSIWATIAAVAFLLFLTCIFFREPLFEGRVFHIADHAAFYVPMHVYNARLRAEGEIPLWNRHGLLGYPNQAENQLSGIYPPGLIFNIVRDPGSAYTYYILFHWLIASAGTLLLLRVLGAGIVGQTVAALVFVFGGTFVGHTYTATEMTTFAWSPLILGLLLRAFSRRDYGPAVLAGVVFEIQIVSSFVQQSFYLFLILLLAMLNEARRPNRRTHFPFVARATLITLAVGFGLSAPQVLYCMEHMSMTELWLGFGYETQVDYSFPPNYLLQLLIPNLFENDKYIFFTLAIVRIYWGLLSLGFIGLGWRSSGQFVALLRIVLALGLILALGRFSGIYNLVCELPRFRQFHYPCRALTIVSLAAAALAGLGADRVVRGDVGARSQRAFTRGYLILAAALLALGITVKSGIHNSFVLRTYDLLTTSGLDKVVTFGLDRTAHLAGFSNSAMIAACLARATGLYWGFLRRHPIRRFAGLWAIGLLAADLLIANGRVHEFGPSDYYSAVPPSVSRLRSEKGLFRVYGNNQDLYHPNVGSFPGDFGTLFGTDTLNSGAGVMLKAPASFLGPYYEYATWKELGLFNVKYFLVPCKLMAETKSNAVTIDPSLRSVCVIAGQIRDHDLQLFELREFQPRVSVREEYVIAPNLSAAKQFINSEEFSTSRSVTLSESPSFIEGNAIEHTAADPQTKIVSYGAQRVVIDATLPRDGILVLSDLNYPDWEATSNGRAVKTLAANGLVRGLALGPDRHRVEFTFHPRGFFTGLYISLTTAIILAVWGLIAAFRRRSSRSR